MADLWDHALERFKKEGISVPVPQPSTARAYRQGRDAYQLGRDFDGCSYGFGPELYAWQSGWIDAQREHVESGEVDDAEA